MRISLDSVRDAREQLRAVARMTPMAPAPHLQVDVGGPVWLKCENLQLAGSFKVRGAYTRMSRLTREERIHGVVAASAGNHAQGVAVAARLLGLPATVFMPVGAPIPKVSATLAYGAEVVLRGETVDQALEAAQAFSAQTGAVLIHPFDHPDVIAGQATIALEILEQVPDVATVVVCVGGGGLIAGIAGVLAEIAPHVEVVGVQAEQASSFAPSLLAGRPQRLTSMATMADGIAVGQPGELTFEIVRDLRIPIRSVSEEQLSEALLRVLERNKLLVEPAGVAGLAAVMEDPAAFASPLVIVLSGGNIDGLLLQRVIGHGLAAAGRYLEVRVRVPDHPGALAAVLSIVGLQGANVESVEHVRTSPDLAIGEGDVDLQLHTRGTVHSAAVIAALAAAGYRTWVEEPTGGYLAPPP